MTFFVSFTLLLLLIVVVFFGSFCVFVQLMEWKCKNGENSKELMHTGTHYLECVDENWCERERMVCELRHTNTQTIHNRFSN